MSVEDERPGRPDMLPPGEEILRLRSLKPKPMTFAAIGARYGTSRQAVEKKLRYYKRRLAREAAAAEQATPENEAPSVSDAPASEQVDATVDA